MRNDANWIFSQQAREQSLSSVMVTMGMMTMGASIKMAWILDPMSIIHDDSIKMPPCYAKQSQILVVSHAWQECPTPSEALFY